MALDLSVMGNVFSLFILPLSLSEILILKSNCTSLYFFNKLLDLHRIVSVNCLLQ